MILIPKIVFERLFKRITSMCREGTFFWRLLFQIVKANVSKDSFRTKLRDENEFINNLDSHQESFIKFKGSAFDGNIDPNKIEKRKHRKKE